MQVKFKKLSDKAVIPKYAREGDAGMDLTATRKWWDEEKRKVGFGTDLAVEIPEGHVGLLFPRSSIVKTQLMLGNAVGVIDSNYRGEITAFFEPQRWTSRPIKNYEVGDRILQLLIIPYPKIEPVEAFELSETERGSSGYGSSGT